MGTERLHLAISDEDLDEAEERLRGRGGLLQVERERAGPRREGQEVPVGALFQGLYGHLGEGPPDPERTAALERDEKARREQEERAKREAWGELGIPRMTWSALLGRDPLEETEAIAAARDFLAQLTAPRRERRVVLGLHGGKGTGKTWAAAWLCSQTQGRRVRAIELARHGAYGTEAAFWRGLERQPQLLAIDDLGREPLDEQGFLLANLRAVLDARYEELYPTVITTNLDRAGFAARYLDAAGDAQGELLLDRLRQRGVAVELAGESLRRSPTLG